MNEFLKTVPFDLYELNLFQLVVRHRSFTKAAAIAGLTQSAITRQMQGMETSIGLKLLERTTRSVEVTAAGQFLYRESIRLLGDVEQSLLTLREDFSEEKKTVRLGVSRSIGLSYLPGFFHANLRRHPEVACQISYISSNEIVTALEANELDLGVFCPSQRLEKTLEITHRFNDAFTLIAPAETARIFDSLPNSKKNRDEWISRQNWLQFDERTNTGQKLAAWTKRQGWRIEPNMRLDSFDLIINLVALGMGVGFVPIRTLALYRKRALRRISLKQRFERELVVVVRRHRKIPAHMANFIANVLF